MTSPAFDRIMDELTVHPKERLGFNKNDFNALTGAERKEILERFLSEVEDGWGFSEQLEWMLGDQYISTLKNRLTSLPIKAHGLVFLPYFIYLKSREREYVTKMMCAIIEADSHWERRERAIGGYVRPLIGKEPEFWDFCRYVILNISGISIKKTAMLWLAFEKGMINELALTAELTACVDALESSQGTDPVARMKLDRLHADMGYFVVNLTI